MHTFISFQNKVGQIETARDSGQFPLIAPAWTERPLQPQELRDTASH